MLNMKEVLTGPQTSIIEERDGKKYAAWVPAIPEEGFGWLRWSGRFRDSIAVLRGQAVAIENWTKKGSKK